MKFMYCHQQPRS